MSRQEAWPQDRSEPYRCCLSAPHDPFSKHADALPMLNEKPDFSSYHAASWCYHNCSDT